MADIKKAMDDSELDTVNGGRMVSVAEEERMRFAGKFASSLLRSHISLEDGLATLKNSNDSLVTDRKLTEEDMQQIASLVKDKYKKGQL